MKNRTKGILGIVTGIVIWGLSFAMCLPICETNFWGAGILVLLFGASAYFLFKQDRIE